VSISRSCFSFAALCIGLELACLGCSRKAADESGPKEHARQGVPGEVVISPSEQAAQGIEVQAAEKSDAPSVLHLPGRIALPDNATWRVGVLTDGRVEKVYANLGDYVRKGQVLARMHSHDVHEARAAYQMALADHTRLESAQALAQTEYERTQRLYALKAVSLEQTQIAHQELVNSQTEASNAGIAVIRERTHLEDTLGVPADIPAGSHDEDQEMIPIVAPASGYVLKKDVTPGSTIQPSTDAFVIGDLSRLWMLASVGADQLTRLRLGQSAAISLPDVPGQSFSGKVVNLGQQFDVTTRQMQIRIEFMNPGGRLRPEMLARAELAEMPAGEKRTVLMVSQEAVQQVNGQDAVFVRSSADHFVMRPVQVGESAKSMIQILSGIRAGEQVVMRGSFLVKSQLLRSSIGD
jgi:cobalt-zinc-cadmium efflux system membrane fusion protein